MKTTRVINTKQIRHDLVGFLRGLSDGQPVTVLYRSTPLVTITAEPALLSYQSADAGSPLAIKRSIALARSLQNRPVRFDPNKSFKQLYDETRTP
jgi:hypothetical protein